MVPHDTLAGKVRVEDVVQDSPAERAGIEPGDTILSINGQQLNSSLDAYRLIQLNLGKEIILLIEHEDATQEDLAVTPRWKPPEGSRGAVGFLINTTERDIVKQSYPFWQAIPLGAKTSIENFILFKNGIISMIIGAVPVELAGPVGIAQMSVEVARAGISPLLEFAAFLSMNLAIINLFPLPALDGGRLAFISLEWIRRGKRISPKREALVHMIGFAMLILFFAIITYRDIIRIVSGESLLP
jgi:regulator of sigma E protease